MFEQKLRETCHKLSLTKQDRMTYTRDAEEIRDAIMNEMKKTSKPFKEWFKGASLTGSYLDDLKIKKPDEFDYHIKLELPVNIKPEVIPDAPAYVRLRVLGNSRLVQFLDSNGFIQRDRVQSWIRDILDNVFEDSTISVSTKNGIYDVKYVVQGFAVAHTLEAVKRGSEYKRISFDFVPVFEFPSHMWLFSKKLEACDRNWFVVPPKYRSDYNNDVFMICVPHWERQMLLAKMNLKDSLRLMKALRDDYNMNRLSSYMLKTLYLIEIERRSDAFWQKPIKDILIHMFSCLEQCLTCRNLPFYWDRYHNLIRYIPEKICDEYLVILRHIVKELRNSTLTLAHF